MADNDDMESLPETPSSFATMELENAHLSKALPQRMGFLKGTCAGGIITESGKNRQMARMLALILTPIIVLITVSFYFVSDNITAKLQSDKVKHTVLFSVEVGKVIHAMQSERDMSVLYLSSIGPETKLFLSDRYIETDGQLDNLAYWPAGLITYQLPQFYSKRDFRQYLTRHRNELDLLNHTLYDELNFYSENIRVFVRWLYDAIKESKYGTIWKTLVAYQKVVEAKEHVGIERAIGSAYFSTGGFVSQQVYEWYNRELHASEANLKSAVRYSAVVGTIASSRISSGGANLTKNIDLYRRIIQRREISVPTLRNATLYFDNMTLYIDLVFLTVKDLAGEIVDVLEGRAESASVGVVRSSIIIFIVLVMCPILAKMMRNLTDDIQRYALTLLDKTCELNHEKRQTASLLHHFLPRAVAEQIIQKREVRAEYYKDITICVLEIKDTAKLITEYTPDDVITVFNSISKLLDEKLKLYDVFKVITIEENYVIASDHIQDQATASASTTADPDAAAGPRPGLPLRNNDNHAYHMADFVLDVMASVSDLDIPPLKDGHKLSVCAGLHTGPCSAGVVGNVMPRYCVFGDVTDVAKSLQESGHANRIHLSSGTHRFLNASGQYIMQYRGEIDIQKSIRMQTYWLLARRADLGASPTTSPIHSVDSTRKPSEVSANRRAPPETA